MQCVAVCCSVSYISRSHVVCCSVLPCIVALQCDAVCCSVLQCVAVCCSVSYISRSHASDQLTSILTYYAHVRSCFWVARVPFFPESMWTCVAVYCSVAVWCSVLQCIVALQCVAVCCSVLQCVAVCCSALLPWKYVNMCISSHTQCITSHIDGTCEWVILYMWMSHVIHVNTSNHNNAWVMSYIDGACEWVMSCHTCKYVSSHTQCITSYLDGTREWVILFMWIRHITIMHESFHTDESCHDKQSVIFWIYTHVHTHTNTHTHTRTHTPTRTHARTHARTHTRTHTHKHTYIHTYIHHRWQSYKNKCEGSWVSQNTYQWVMSSCINTSCFDIWGGYD